MQCIYIGVSKNRGTPKSSILIGFSIMNHPFWGTPIFGNTHMFSCVSTPLQYPLLFLHGAQGTAFFGLPTRLLPGCNWRSLRIPFGKIGVHLREH